MEHISESINEENFKFSSMLFNTLFNFIKAETETHANFIQNLFQG